MAHVVCGEPQANPNPTSSPTANCQLPTTRPTGHSSLSAAGLGFLTFWLLGQLRAFAAPSPWFWGAASAAAPPSKGRQWRFLVAILPSFGAVAVAVTRVLDYWHFPSDVLTGAWARGRWGGAVRRQGSGALGGRGVARWVAGGGRGGWQGRGEVGGRGRVKWVEAETPGVGARSRVGGERKGCRAAGEGCEKGGGLQARACCSVPV